MSNEFSIKDLRIFIYWFSDLKIVISGLDKNLKISDLKFESEIEFWDLIFPWKTKFQSWRFLRLWCFQQLFISKFCFLISILIDSYSSRLLTD